VGQLPHVIIENRRVLGLSADDPIRLLPDKRPGYEKDYLHRPRLDFTAALGVEGGKAAWYKHEDLAVRLTKRAVDWLHEQTAEQPFFLYLAHRNIHSPQRCNERFKGKSEIGAYGDFILELDWSVGEVLKALDEKGLAKNTLVFFSSDNGGVVRYKPTDSASINSHKVNGPLRGQKTDAYEGGHRVPLIARWPGRIPTNTEDSSLIALTDMLATFAEFFGMPLPENAGEDSFSFLGALLGEKPKQTTRQAIVNDGFSGVFAIRQGDWKLILSQHGGGAGMLNVLNDPSKPAGQLYHLGRDIGESKNEYDQHPEIVKSLSDLLEQYKQTGRSAPKDRSAAAETRS